MSTAEVASAFRGRPSWPKEQVAEAIRFGISEGRHPPSKPLPTYRHLASQYGVSTATVSAAVDLLEDAGLVRREGRRGAFVQAIESSPDVLADAEALGRLRRISFLSSSVRLELAHLRHDYLTGFSEALEHLDIPMRFAEIPPLGEPCEGMFSDRMPLASQACVLIQSPRADLLRWLHERGVAAVVLNFARYSLEGLPDHHRVYVNKYKGAMDATEHLLELGHRRIGFVGRTEFSPRKGSVRIFHGYRAALNAAGLDCLREDLLESGAEHPAEVLGPATAFLKRSDRPTAVLTHNDAMALGMMQAARDLGIRVPRDLSVVGFADEPEAATSDPPLTTVCNPRRTLARRAVTMLLNAWAGEYDSFQTEVINCHLVVRQSTAPPPR